MKELPIKVDLKKMKKLTEDAEKDMKRQRRLIMLEQQKAEKSI